MKKFIIDNKENVMIAFVSLIAFIIGCLAVGWLPAMLVIGIADLLLFAPILRDKVNIKKPNIKFKKANANYEGTSSSKKQGRKSMKKKSKTKRIILTILCIGVISVIALMVLFAAYIVINAPDFSPKKLYKQESTIIYYNNNEELTTLGAENRELVTYDQLPEVLINAIVATEDSRFFQHNGVDWARFLKATAGQLAGSRNAGGASTLTMQISKNAFTSKEATGIKGIIRKFTDVYISMHKIEKKYSKEQIMEFYVNSYYLGSGAYGVEQASRTYFGKSVSDINLAEAALLAGLFQAPGSYDPNINIEAAKQRQTTVLKLMVKHGYITEEEKDAALAIDLDKLVVDRNKAENGSIVNEYQAFVDTVVEDVKKKTGDDPYKVPMKIYSTMDKDKQDHINKIMKGDGFKWVDEKVTAGISAIDIKTGAIVAVGAGRDKTKARTYNTATQTNRQIGSTAKPLYDYGPGIEYENWSTYHPFTDENISYSDGTKINNWDNSYKGYMTARAALQQSRNIPALKAFKSNKVANIKEFVTNLGLHPEANLHQAHAIGGYTGESPLSMSVAYAAFGNGGYYVEPYSYTKIVYRDTNKTEEVKINKKRAMSEETAYMVYDMLKTSGKWGLGAEANINGAEFGAKTGTSNYDEATLKANGLPSSAINDYWVCGVSPDYAIAVWYGYDKIYKNYYNKNGTKYHRTLFQAVAKGFFKKGSTIKQPSGVVSVTVENETLPEQLPSENTPSNMKVTELFKKGTEPAEVSTRFNRLSDVTGLKGSVSGSTLTLSWTPIATPDAINKEKVTALMSRLWESSGARNSAIEKRLSYFGNVTYKIYAKSSSGLTLVESTTSNTANIPVTNASPTEYVVKSEYSNYSALASNGVSVKVDVSGAAAAPQANDDPNDNSNTDNTGNNTDTNN